MKLVRLAVISLAPGPKTPAVPCVIRGGGVDVEVSAVPDSTGHNRQTQLIAKALTSLANPGLDAEGFVVIPNDSRRQCEVAIMRVADLFAITTRSRRHIVTGTPPVALIPESEVDRALLSGAVAIRAHAPRPLSTIHGPINISDVVASLSDRWDGVSMLAEAYSHTMMSGRFRDFVRLFELAFGRSFMQLQKKLSQTLAPAMGYTIGEIRTWQSLRHPFSHADGQTTTEVAFEEDARPVVQRMEQAALDILLNKADWRTWSSSRRDVWKPIGITTNESGTGVIRRGSTPSVEFLLLDEFGVFPRVLELQHTGLPIEWWHRMVPNRTDPT